MAFITDIEVNAIHQFIMQLCCNVEIVSMYALTSKLLNYCTIVYILT